MNEKIPGYKEFESYIGRKKVSRNSKEAYEKDLSDFFLFLNYKSLNEIEEEDILKFIEKLKQKYSNNSINRKIISIRGYLKYFYKIKKINTLPLENIKNLPPKKKELELLTLEEINKLKEIIGNSPKEYRDKLILDTLYHTGLLISEVLGLESKNIIDEEYEVLVLISGTEIKRIPLGEELGGKFKIFLEKYINSFSTKSSKIFSSISRQNFRARLIKYGKLANIKKDIYPHMIRNSVLKNIIDTEGAHAVKERMGDSTIKHTSLYQGRNIKKIKEKYMEIGIGD